jgi:arginine/lysine/ornithine decarboxylase
MLTVAAGMRAAIGSTSFRRRFKQSARADAYKRETFARLVRREVEQVPAVQLEGRISAVQVVP